MRKMRILLIILVSIILLPCIDVNARSQDCTPAIMEEYQRQLSNLDISYEVMPKGTKAYNVMLDEDIDVSNKVKITFANLPDDFYIDITNTRSSDPYYPPVSTGDVVYLNGGVYTLEIGHIKCENRVKKYEIKVPMYDDGNKKNVFFDGTYEQKSAPKNEAKKEKTSLTLVIIVIVLLVVIVLVIGLLFRKKGQI